MNAKEKLGVTVLKRAVTAAAKLLRSNRKIRNAGKAGRYGWPILRFGVPCGIVLTSAAWRIA